MKILLMKLEYEHGIMCDLREVWQNETNYRVMENYISEYCSDCPGVPFFINTDTNQTICGEVGYKKFTNWALGGRVQ